MPRKSRFICVEIILRTNHDCDAFVQWSRSDDNNFIDKMPWDTHCWQVVFSPLQDADADTTIQRLCKTIQELPTPVRKQWDDAEFREFFAGYDIGHDPIAYQHHLKPETLAMAARIGAGIGIALYPPSMKPDDE